VEGKSFENEESKHLYCGGEMARNTTLIDELKK